MLNSFPLISDDREGFAAFITSEVAEKAFPQSKAPTAYAIGVVDDDEPVAMSVCELGNGYLIITHWASIEGNIGDEAFLCMIDFLKSFAADNNLALMASLQCPCVNGDYGWFEGKLILPEDHLLQLYSRAGFSVEITRAIQYRFTLGELPLDMFKARLTKQQGLMPLKFVPRSALSSFNAKTMNNATQVSVPEPLTLDNIEADVSVCFCVGEVIRSILLVVKNGDELELSYINAQKSFSADLKELAAFASLLAVKKYGSSAIISTTCVSEQATRLMLSYLRDAKPSALYYTAKLFPDKAEFEGGE